MEDIITQQLLAGTLAGTGSGLTTAIFYMIMREEKLKSKLREERTAIVREVEKDFYDNLDSVLKQSRSYTDDKSKDLKDDLSEIKSSINKLENLLITMLTGDK